jgi:hypothetical protein
MFLQCDKSDLQDCRVTLPARGLLHSHQGRKPLRERCSIITSEPFRSSFISGNFDDFTGYLRLRPNPMNPPFPVHFHFPAQKSKRNSSCRPPSDPGCIIGERNQIARGNCFHFMFDVAVRNNKCRLVTACSADSL